MSIVALVNLVLSLLNKFADWGARTKIFKEDEAIIASKILAKAMEDIKLVKESNARLDAEFRTNPDSILSRDEFTRD